MDSLTSHELMRMFLSLGVLLAFASLLGELARYLKQPSIAGELLAGVLLGPTVLGAVTPSWKVSLFPASGTNAILLDGLSSLSISLFLLVAGLEVDLSTLWKQGKRAIAVGVTGVLLPFSAGFLLAWYAPGIFGFEPGASRIIFSLFIATILSISALPVIARILMDLGLYRTGLGTIVVASAVFDDLAGWIVFTMLLGIMGATNRESTVYVVFWLTLFGVSIMTAGRRLFGRMLPWLQERLRLLQAVVLSLGLMGAAGAEWIGVHAIFGSFLVGVAAGSLPDFHEHTRTIIREFVTAFFAPLSQKIPTTQLDTAARKTIKLFEESREQIVTVLTVMVERTRSALIEELRDSAKSLKSYFSQEEIIGSMRPQGNFMTRDSLAMSQGIVPPHHIVILAWLQSKATAFHNLGELGKIAKRAAAYLERRQTERIVKSESAVERIFIGHGRSPVWRELKEFSRPWTCRPS